MFFVLMLFINVGCTVTKEPNELTSIAAKNKRYLISDNKYFEMKSPVNWRNEYEFDPFLKEYKMYLTSSSGQMFKMRMMLSLHEKESEMLIDSERKTQRLIENSAKSAAERVGSENIEFSKLTGEYSNGFAYSINYPEDNNEVAFTGSVQSNNLFITFLATTNIDTKTALDTAKEMILSIKFEESN